MGWLPPRDVLEQAEDPRLREGWIRCAAPFTWQVRGAHVAAWKTIRECPHPATGRRSPHQPMIQRPNLTLLTLRFAVPALAAQLNASVAAPGRRRP